jgi:D-amino-acid dehydrogenase
MKTIVLGSGIIGTTTAYFLAKAGHEVHVVDRQPEAAMETSFANGGVLHTSEAEPWSRPGMPRAVLSWIGKENAPMLLRLGAPAGDVGWGIDFVRNCSPERYRKAAANVRLANHAVADGGCAAPTRASPMTSCRTVRSRSTPSVRRSTPTLPSLSGSAMSG